MTIKDHLRSLSDKKLPASPEPTPETSTEAPEPTPESSTEAPASSVAEVGNVADCLVTVTADEKTGKGFIVDGKGKIATNFHLVNKANRIKVTTRSGDVFLGKAIRLDEGRDLALIQIPTRTPQYLILGDAQTIDVGEDVFVLGNPSGTSAGLTKTVISALRVIRGTVLILVDQQIDPGNSGSPIVTQLGTVVGIASYKFGREDDSAGFAISVKELKAFISGQ